MIGHDDIGMDNAPISLCQPVNLLLNDVRDFCLLQPGRTERRAIQLSVKMDKSLSFCGLLLVLQFD